MIRTIIVILLLLSQAQATDISLKTSAWTLQGTWYCGPKHPTATANGFAFDFPQSSTGCFAVYLTNSHLANVAISGTLTMTLSVTTIGTPVFNYSSESENTCANGCCAPATVRPYFEGSVNYSVTNRWWANPNSYMLGPGSIILSVPITPDQWSDTDGQFGNTNADTLAGFNAAISNVREIGMTFGGGCFFGHGVNVSGGTAQLLVSGYTIN